MRKPENIELVPSSNHFIINYLFQCTYMYKSDNIIFNLDPELNTLMLLVLYILMHNLGVWIERRGDQPFS